jgi:S-adenosylmethionine/arginine decarboxylase-like enzyme
LNPEDRGEITVDRVLNILEDIVTALGMKRSCDPRIIFKAPGDMTVYQIVSTSHIIMHFSPDVLHADLFSCEPFDVDASIGILTETFGTGGMVQYCQRNLIADSLETSPIPMRNLNTLTSNPGTLTHAMVNWYRGDDSKLGDIERGTNILKDAVACITDDGIDYPASAVLLLDVDPIEGSWDKGGYSGGYVTLRRQLTIHTFHGINAAYTDIMGHVYDLERIITIIGTGLGFEYYEIDGIFQRRTGFPAYNESPEERCV